MSADTTVVTVSHNSSGVLVGLLASIGQTAPCIVVDNGGTDAVADIAQAHGARLIRLSQNEGFGRGCNAGAALARSEFLFFVNPDVVLAPGCIAGLEAAARRMPQMTAANPLVLDGQGRATFRLSSVLLPRQPRRLDAPKVPTEIPVLSGCALFVRRSDFEAVGGFDPQIFLYHEDHDLALRLRARGTLWHVSDAVARHVAGTGSLRTPGIAWFKGYHMARSRHFVLHKHGHRFAFLRTLGPALGGLCLPHNLLSRRRRSRTLGQVAGALSVLGDHGRYVPE